MLGKLLLAEIGVRPLCATSVAKPHGELRDLNRNCTRSKYHTCPDAAWLPLGDRDNACSL